MNQSLHFKVPTAFEHQKRRTERFSMTMACSHEEAFLRAGSQ